MKHLAMVISGRPSDWCFQTVLTLMVFLKDFLEKINTFKKSTGEKQLKTY